LRRRGSVLEKYERIGHYHHLRYLMLNLSALLRIKERGGALSGVFG